MSDEIKVTEEATVELKTAKAPIKKISSPIPTQKVEEADPLDVSLEELKNEAENFKFFKNCSASLKKLSLIVFIINLFLIIVTAFIGIILVATYLGAEMISLLVIPIFSLVAIFVVIARLISGLIYGFAEIVEKHEK